jgi:rod shape-determining protein MreD
MVGWRLCLLIAFLLFNFFVIALVLESSVFCFLTINGVFPDIVAIITILFGFLRGPRQGAVIGFAGGLLADILTGRLVGLGALIMAFIGALSGFMGTRFMRDRYLLILALIAVCTVLQNTLYTFGMWVFGWQIPIFDEVFGVLPYLIIYNCLLAMLLYPIISKLNHFMEKVAIVKPKDNKTV